MALRLPTEPVFHRLRPPLYMARLKRLHIGVAIRGNKGQRLTCRSPLILPCCQANIAGVARSFGHREHHVSEQHPHVAIAVMRDRRSPAHL
jgi:hypothetical protein